MDGALEDLLGEFLLFASFVGKEASAEGVEVSARLKHLKSGGFGRGKRFVAERKARAPDEGWGFLVRDGRKWSFVVEREPDAVGGGLKVQECAGRAEAKAHLAP